MEGFFCATDSWSSAYQRNNKGGGLKNLRCFPYCKDVHVDRGYCGAPVSVELSSENEPTGKLFALAAFRTLQPEVVEDIQTNEDDEQDSEIKRPATSTKEFQVGETIKISKLLSLVSDNVIPKKFFRGDVEVSATNKDIKKVVFNVENKGWNYSWHGTKHTSRTEHCLSVYVCEQISGSEARFVGIIDSPTFTVFSRKKKRRRKSSEISDWKRNRVNNPQEVSDGQVLPTTNKPQMIFPVGMTSTAPQVQAQALQYISQVNALSQYYQQVAMVQSLLSGTGQSFLQPVQAAVMPQNVGSFGSFPLQNNVVLQNLLGQNLGNFQPKKN